MKKLNFINIVKHSLRVIISVTLCFVVIYFYEFETFYNIMIFMGIYIIVSILLELIFKKFKKNDTII